MASCSPKTVTPNAVLVGKLAEFLSSNNLRVCWSDEVEKNETGSKGSGGCRAEVENEVKNCLAGLRRTLESSLSLEFKAFASNDTASTTTEKTQTTVTEAAGELAKTFVAFVASKSDEHERLVKLQWEAEMETVKMLRKELTGAKGSIFKEKNITAQLHKEKNELEALLMQEREGRMGETSKWNQEKQMILNERAKLLQFLEAIKQCSNFAEEREAELEFGDETDLVASHVRKVLSKCENGRNQLIRMDQECGAEENEEQVSMSLCEETSLSVSSLLPPSILELEKSVEDVEEFTGDIIEKPALVLSKATPRRRIMRMRHCKSPRGSRKCLCGMKFKTVNIMKAHLKLYSNDWKFECVMCPERFFSLAHLKRHMINTHDISDPLSEYKIGCRMCGEMFQTRTGFHMHHNAVHSSKRQPGNICDEYGEKQDLAFSFETSTQQERNCSEDDYSDIPILENEMENI